MAEPDAPEDPWLNLRRLFIQNFYDREGERKRNRHKLRQEIRLLQGKRQVKMKPAFTWCETCAKYCDPVTELHECRKPAAKKRRVAEK